MSNLFAQWVGLAEKSAAKGGQKSKTNNSVMLDEPTTGISAVNKTASNLTDLPLRSPSQ